MDMTNMEDAVAAAPGDVTLRIRFAEQLRERGLFFEAMTQLQEASLLAPVRYSKVLAETVTSLPFSD